MGKCALCSKRLEGGKGPFFQVPKEKQLRHDWARACNRELRVTDRICADHFCPSDILNLGIRKHLKQNALPNISEYNKVKNAEAQNIGDSGDIVLNSSSLTRPVYITTYTIGDVEERAVDFATNLVAEKPAVLLEDNQTQTDSTILKSNMQLEIVSLKKELKALKTANRSLESQLTEANAVLNNFKKIFTEGQMRKMIIPSKNVQWSWKDISNAICLHTAGPRAYNHLYRKGFPLPSESTLQRWYRKTNVKEGILTASLDSMSSMSELSHNDKICVISFDEMKVSETYEYDQIEDYVRKPANYVQLAMVRGLLKSWKHPIFYDYDCQMSKEILNSIISALQNIGFTVVAVVCDMGPTNRRLWKDLSVTMDKPWFPNPAVESAKVFVFADVPHLLKLIRNHFLDTGLIWKGELLTARTLHTLLDLTSSSDASIVFRLSEEHLSVKGIGRQKVKLAAQLFSHTIANAIKRCYISGFELYKPVETADFFKLVNDWFDIVNSSMKTFAYPGKEPFGKVFSTQLKVLSEMNEFMLSPIVPYKKELVYFQKGVVQTNRALVMLYEYLQNKSNVEYILTRRLNQDVLEHFFSAMRGDGGGNDHPTPKDFKYRLRKYILAKNTELLKNTGNVQSDGTEWLKPSETKRLRDFKDHSSPTKAIVIDGISDIEMKPVIDKLSISQPVDMGILHEDALEYISGYIIRKMDLKEHESSENTMTWVDQVSKGSLKKPSSRFLQSIKSLESVFYNLNSKEIVHCKNVKQILLERSSEIDLSESVKRFFFKCRIHFRVKDLNKRLKIKKAKQRIMGYKKYIKIKL